MDGGPQRYCRHRRYALQLTALAKGRIERQFGTAQDRLVKGMRVAGVRRIEEANAYLENEFLPRWNQTLTVEPAQAADAHRPLGKEHDLAAILSHVELRQVTNDYTVRYRGKLYQIDRQDVRVGMRKAMVRVEERLDRTVAARFQGRYLRIRRCAQPLPDPRPEAVAANQPQPTPKVRRKSDWMKDFFRKPGPTLEQAIGISNARS